MNEVADTERGPLAKYMMVFAGIAVGLCGLCYWNAFFFLGPVVDLGMGLASALAARGIATQLRESHERYHPLAGGLLAPLSFIALTFFATGIAVFATDAYATEVGRIESDPLDFVALIPAREGGTHYEANYEYKLSPGFDSARIAFGSIEGDRIQKLDVEVPEGSEVQTQRVEPEPEHRVALMFRRSPSSGTLKLKLHAELKPGDTPELIHVAVAVDQAKRDLWWRVIRYFRAHY